MSDAQEVLKKHSGLRLRFRSGIPFQIWGTYSIHDDRGALQGSFEIEVTIPSNYPHGFPVLKELSKKIERTLDRHIGPSGVICEEIDQKEKIIASKGITIKEYFDQYVFKHFCWQLIYEEEGNKNLQEWSHFGDGTLQFYREELSTDDTNFVERTLEALVSNTLPGRNEKCICGSNRKTKFCHLDNFEELKCIGKMNLRKDLVTVRRLRNKAP